MIKVKKGQDPYSVIGQYITDHVSAIEDMIAVIEIDGKISNELFMVDMTVDGYFIWKSDWYEGGENVVLIDFFPVSDACNPKDYWIPCSERLPKKAGNYLVTNHNGDIARYIFLDSESSKDYWMRCVKAWMPLPKPYEEEKR